MGEGKYLENRPQVVHLEGLSYKFKETLVCTFLCGIKPRAVILVVFADVMEESVKLLLCCIAFVGSNLTCVQQVHKNLGELVP